MSKHTHMFTIISANIRKHPKPMAMVLCYKSYYAPYIQKCDFILLESGLGDHIFTNSYGLIFTLIVWQGEYFAQTVHSCRWHTHVYHYSDVTMGQWRLKSPASQSLTQWFVQAQIKENIKAPRHWPLCGEFTGDRWIPRSDAENASIWWRHHVDCHIINIWDIDSVSYVNSYFSWGWISATRGPSQ